MRKVVSFNARDFSLLVNVACRQAVIVDVAKWIICVQTVFVGDELTHEHTVLLLSSFIKHFLLEMFASLTLTEDENVSQLILNVYLFLWVFEHEARCMISSV